MNYINPPLPQTKRLIIRVTKFQRIRWTGYVAFMEQRRHDGKRGLTRPRRT